MKYSYYLQTSYTVEKLWIVTGLVVHWRIIVPQGYMSPKYLSLRGEQQRQGGQKYL